MHWRLESNNTRPSFLPPCFWLEWGAALGDECWQGETAQLWLSSITWGYGATGCTCILAQRMQAFEPVWISSIHLKSWTQTCIFTPGRWGQADSWAPWPSSLAKLVCSRFSEILSRKIRIRTIEEGIQCWPLASHAGRHRWVHTQCTYTCTWIHTQCTYTCTWI